MENPNTNSPANSPIPGLTLGNATPTAATIVNPTASVSAAERGDELTLKEVVEQLNQMLLVIRAKWYWGLISAIIFGGLVGYALFKRPVEVSAQTSLIADSTLDKIIGIRLDNSSDVGAHEETMRNLTSGMSSRKFRERLSSVFTPAEVAEISAPYLSKGLVGDREFLINFFESRISVERERGRDYFTVEVKHVNPQTAIMIANKFTSEYILQAQQDLREASRAGYEALVKQSDAVREEIAKDEQEQLEFRKKNRIISVNDNQSLLADRLRRLDGNLTDTRVQRLTLETQYQRSKADREAHEYPWDNYFLATYLDNQQQQQQLNLLTAQKNTLARKYGPQHPKIRDVETSIRAVQANIQRNFDVAISDMKVRVENLRKQEVLLQKEFDDTFNESIEIQKIATRYAIIGSDIDTLRESLTQLKQKIATAHIQAEIPTDVMRVVDPGFIRPSKVPKRLIHIVATLFVAFGAFIFGPLVVNLFDEKINATVDIEALLGKPMLGAVPALKARAEDRAHVVRDRVDATITESFVGIAGGLDVSTGSKYPKCMLITSTLPGEGKSTVVSNLASAYAQIGKSVVVIDMDLRRPTQHRQHGLPDDKGFISWAKAGFNFEGIERPDGPFFRHILPDGVHLVSSGGNDPHPTNFLVSKQMERLMASLMRLYDVVILDTAPAGLFQDSLVLARFTQQRLLVARVGKAPVEQVKKVVTDFDRAKVGFTGVVINGFVPNVSHKKLAYGYNVAAYGYKVESKEGAPEKKE